MSIFVILMGSFVTATFSPTLTAEELPSSKFRQEHVQIREHLRHISESVGAMPDTPAEQRKTMQETVRFFRGHIRPHAEWEEKVLYPAVDKRAGNEKYFFTSTMRYDHKIVGRWIDELKEEAESKPPNARGFTRKTDRLLGLLDAHFEKEEQVLLPILDKTMSKAEFDKEITSKAKH